MEYDYLKGTKEPFCTRLKATGLGGGFYGTAIVAAAIIALHFNTAFASEEIVFRFTEEQAGEACKAWIKGKKADPFSVIRSEDDNYALVCLEQGHWTLLKKGVHDGDKQQWDPVEREYHSKEVQ